MPAWFRRSSLPVLCTFLATGACGGSSQDAPDDASASDAADGGAFDTTPVPRDTAPRDVAPEVDHGTPSDTYPAYKVDLPKLQNAGGYVMTAPKIVTVTWPSDKAADKFEAFGDHIGATDYWKAITAEYGIAPAVSGPDAHVRVAEPPPAKTSVDELDAYVVDRLTNLTDSKWPSPTTDSIYVLYLSSSTMLDYQGSNACLQIGGYHTSTDVGGQEVSYAIIPYCRGFGGGYFDSMTSAASHELGEASTDPQPRLGRGYDGFDLNHVAWEIFQQYLSENGDACALYQDSFFRSDEPDFAYQVQRQWSNASAQAGHDPCAPVPDLPYFTVVPQALEPIVVNLGAVGGSTKTHTKGFAIAVGDTRTITVGFASDGPTERWSLDALEGNPIYGPTAGGDHLDLSVTAPSGKNGELGYVAITVLTAPKTKYELVTLVSTNSAGTTHYMPVLIANP